MIPLPEAPSRTPFCGACLQFSVFNARRVRSSLPSIKCTHEVAFSTGTDESERKNSLVVRKSHRLYNAGAPTRDLPAGNFAGLSFRPPGRPIYRPLLLASIFLTVLLYLPRLAHHSLIVPRVEQTSFPVYGAGAGRHGADEVEGDQGAC